MQINFYDELTEYSVISPDTLLGGSHDKWAPSLDFEILIPDGAPGKPGKQVLNEDGCEMEENESYYLVN